MVWVDGGNATAYRVDPTGNRVAGTLRLPAGSRLAAVARGSLWLADEAAGTIRQADPRTGRIRRTVTIGSVPAGPTPLQEGFRLAFDGEVVWVARLHTDVVRLDWARGTITGWFTIGVPGASWYDLVVADGGVALTHGDERDADQLDPRTGKATPIHLGGASASTRPATGWCTPLRSAPRESTAAGSPWARARSGSATLRPAP